VPAPSGARRQTLPESQCPMVWDLKQTSVEEEQPERAAMFLIHFVRCSVVSQRKVKALPAHLITNCVSSKGPTNSTLEYLEGSRKAPGSFLEGPAGSDGLARDPLGGA